MAVIRPLVITCPACKQPQSINLKIVEQWSGTTSVCFSIQPKEFHHECVLPRGLCANKDDHDPHAVLEGSLAPYWCSADQRERLPFAAEERRR